ncbi:MAG: thioredoxin-dependent thiol peroxidase [Candidatus Omnitrophica bacterium]|nr:thioredoxin-dependent thiol peroxidase [Candidatus Omnitrophota bacterium]MCB9720264.1 thioredoxin-dependent thiol peroxidase [Candidatus Omnitrophota bacterium]
MTLKENDKAPGFNLPNQDGEKVKLTDFKGKWLLLYFYPKDNTPGCTKEACTMQENLKQFNKLDFAVVGASTDSVASHKKFAEKFGLAFDLLADEDQILVKDYGVWGKKKFMGKEYLGINRSSFLIDPKGKIAKIYAKVKPEEHADEVLADLKEIQSQVKV